MYFYDQMQLMINTSSCKYYCVRSCMYVRAQVCDTLPHMATVGRDSHGASHVCPPTPPCLLWASDHTTDALHCLHGAVFLLWDNQGEIFEYLGQRKRHNLYSNCLLLSWLQSCAKRQKLQRKNYRTTKGYTYYVQMGARCAINLLSEILK